MQAIPILLRKNLEEIWSKEPLPIDDLQIDLFAKIMFKTFSPPLSFETALFGQHKKRSFSLEKLNEKIETFIQSSPYFFTEICTSESYFCFKKSIVSQKAVQAALQTDNTFLFHLIYSVANRKKEKEVNEHLEELVSRLDLCAVAETCVELLRAYVEERKTTAGYSFLWLLKKVAYCSYNIPKKKSFTLLTVFKILDSFLANPDSTAHLENFIELLYYRKYKSDPFLYELCLTSVSRNIFADFVAAQLADISMNDWPNKKRIIKKILESVALEDRIIVASILSASNDPITKQIGDAILAIQKSSSFNEAIEPLYEIKELFPQWSDLDLERIFNQPFKEFCIVEKDLEFARRILIKDPILVHDSLMIGVHQSYIANSDNPIHYLLAYDINTQKLIWGVLLFSFLENPPLGLEESFNYHLKLVDGSILLRFDTEQTMYFIDPLTGTLQFSFTLSEMAGPYFHTAGGKTYQSVYKDYDQFLLGGKIENQEWNFSFETKISRGNFFSLSTHCGFRELFQTEGLLLFGPTGEKKILAHCIDARAYLDTLYCIEKEKEACFLTLRTLKPDKEVVSGISKKFLLPVETAFFGEICCNQKKVILFSKNTLLFIDLEKNELTISDYKPSATSKSFIDSELGELWTWDFLSKEVWKIDSNEAVFLGILNKSYHTKLLHIDKEKRLYIK